MNHSSEVVCLHSFICMHMHVCLHPFMYHMRKFGGKMVSKWVHFRIKIFHKSHLKRHQSHPTSFPPALSHRIKTHQPHSIFCSLVGPKFIIRTIQIVYWINKPQDLQFHILNLCRIWEIREEKKGGNHINLIFCNCGRPPPSHENCPIFSYKW